jgi:hypothetical protein
MTKIEIIDETVAFYSEDTTRRSFKEGRCLYQSADGRKCAYARCWKDGVYKEKFERRTVEVLSELGFEPDSLLDEKYHGHSVEFWMDIQVLHDRFYCWNENGLSEEGKIFVQELKEKYI